MAKTCIKCNTTESKGWYFGNICRSCRRKELRDTPSVLKARQDREYKKLNPECLTCSVTTSNRWYKDHTQCQSCLNKEYRSLNKEKIKLTYLRYKLNNKDKIKEARRKWRQLNAVKRRAEQKMRKNRKRTATLPYVDKKELKKIYMNCPQGYTVDHIIPLKHDLVCGLEVPWNLQYLTMSDNCKKHNKFDGTYENNSWRNNE